MPLVCAIDQNEIIILGGLMYRNEMSDVFLFNTESNKLEEVSFDASSIESKFCSNYGICHIRQNQIAVLRSFANNDSHQRMEFEVIRGKQDPEEQS